jgi:dolichol-phosphate mannosyltransferase
VPEILKVPGTEVRVVDDQSPDGTGAGADALAPQPPGRVHVLHRTGRRGLGVSYVDGFRRAVQTDADVVVQMDADRSHDPQHDFRHRAQKCLASPLYWSRAAERVL